MARMPSAERRRQLTEAAVRVMARDGVARTTTRSVSAEAGVSLSVFHYCFDSKQALLEAVIALITDRYVAMVKEVLRPRATLGETVRAGFQAYWDHVVAHPGQHMLTYELTQYALREPGSAHLAHRQYGLYADAYRELIEQLGEHTGFVPAVPVPVLAEYLAAVTDGLTLHALARGGDTAAPEILDLVTAQVTALATGRPES
ncbi:TetR/AcrR family transcriptional regulator [Streptomyces sp. NPDC097619]|uniref:TetR/AcrR family transcriptional regulator n=1 Tax=Streptomyces sp. NPDC097619 TaxID=3157228 RepID=UPI0033321539